ncbi:MAG: TIM-barrel domain-containing protein, partial [Bacteroidota bacterium]
MFSVLRPGKLNEPSFDKSGFSADASGAHCRVRWFSDHIVNVRLARTDTPASASYAVIREPMESAPSFKSNGTEVTSAGKYFSVIISGSDATIRFETPDGEVINADEPGLGTCWNGDQVTAYKHLQEGERFIGLGEKVGPLDRRGRGYVHYNTDAFAYGSGTDPIYSTIPFYIGIHSGLVYGIFFDNPARTTFNFGASNNRFSSFAADVGDMNYYFIYGSNIPEIIRAYTWLTGTTPLPPKWSLGFQQCRYSYYPESEVMNLARNFREHNIPADTLVLDIHYMDAYKIFTWHPQHFPEPEKMIADLKQDGFNVVVMCDPGIKVEHGYPPYDEGLKDDLFIKYPDHKLYEGQVWPGWCHFPDFTDPNARASWARWMKSYADIGVGGYWNDMNEFSSWGQMMPENLLFNFEGQGGTARQGRNSYGLQMARATYEGVKQHLHGKRPFNLTRSGYAGIQRYAALWTGDNVSYDEHMMLGVRLVNSLGLSGVAFAGY